MSLDGRLALARQGSSWILFLPAYTGISTGPASSPKSGHRAPATIVAADLGQPDNPPVEDGLALMADALHATDFTDEEITTMIVDNSQLLAGADVLRADPRRI